MKLNDDANLAEFPPLCFFFLCLLFSIDFPKFYRWSLRVPRTFLTPRNTQAIKGHHGSQQSTWANVGRRVLPSGLGRGETVALSWDRALSLNDKFLVGTCFWLVVTCSIKNTPPGICLHHLAEEIHPRLGMGTCPTGAFLIPKHVPFTTQTHTTYVILVSLKAIFLLVIVVSQDSCS